MSNGSVPDRREGLIGGMKIQCVNCGDTFWVTDEEQNFYRRRKLRPPRRCSECRKNRRRERDEGMKLRPVKGFTGEFGGKSYE